MQTPRVTTAEGARPLSSHPAFKVAAALVFIGGTAAAYALDRILLRWLQENAPFPDPFAGISVAIHERADNYRRKRAGVLEFLGLAWEVFGAIADAAGSSDLVMADPGRVDRPPNRPARDIGRSG